MKGVVAIAIMAQLTSCAPHAVPVESELSRNLNEEVLPDAPEEAYAGRRFSDPRLRGLQRLRVMGGDDIADAIVAGVTWLVDHQSEDGGWRAEDFDAGCPDEDRCEGKGGAFNDVGVTGLALLALLGTGSTHRQGPYRHAVKKSALWLLDRQDEQGLFGPAIAHSYMYSHAIATMALSELAGMSGSQLLRPRVQKGIDYILQARNPYKVWRYFPRDGDNDSSVTGWVVMALVSARRFEFKVQDFALKHALAWYDEVTDPGTGEVGYTKLGDGAGRDEETRKRFPDAGNESLTALGLSCRILMGQTPDKNPEMLAAADYLLKKVPSWSQEGGVDFCYWYYGSIACYQMGGKWWKGWKKGLRETLIDHQVKVGHAKGSWNPDGVWGQSGGRVLSTALAVSSLQVYYRYSNAIVR